MEQAALCGIGTNREAVCCNVSALAELILLVEGGVKPVSRNAIGVSKYPPKKWMIKARNKFRPFQIDPSVLISAQSLPILPLALDNSFRSASMSMPLVISMNKKPIG
jgi:hypothetical protein